MTMNTAPIAAVRAQLAALTAEHDDLDAYQTPAAPPAFRVEVLNESGTGADGTRERLSTGQSASPRHDVGGTASRRPPRPDLVAISRGFVTARLLVRTPCLRLAVEELFDELAETIVVAAVHCWRGQRDAVGLV